MVPTELFRVHTGHIETVEKEKEYMDLFLCVPCWVELKIKSVYKNKNAKKTVKKEESDDE